MLYQTLFLLLSSISTTSSLQVGLEMECVIVEAALKTSFRKEMGFKNSQADIFDELCAPNNVQPNVMSSDDFIVDELLDFSNEEDEQHLVIQEDDEKQQTQQQEEFVDDKISEFSGKVDFECIPASELCVPSDDLASLEWLSHFVEDSNSEYSAPFPAGAFLEKPKVATVHGGSVNKSSIAFCVPQKPVLTENCFKTPFPVKARSKRTRTGVRVWPLCSPSLTESSSSTSSSSSSSFSSPSSPCLLFTAPDFNRELTEPIFYEKTSVKKPKNRFSGELGSGGGGGGYQSVRRCSHCGVQKTPQWRAGPLGAKTLCNACGVRFKSGRLLPEYRPACSPTFSSEVHSNHHRKVLEMRKKKEILGPAEPGLAAHEVPSF